jgi:arylsulfatase A-like enzyme
MRLTIPLLLLLFATSFANAQNSRPNVVLILVDDMGLHDLSVEGSTFYQSPNIDKLAHGGMRFTQGYANCRVCSPSRASIQLGKFTARHGVTQWIGAKSGLDWNRQDPILSSQYRHELPADDLTLAESLQQAGYMTFFAGKWHLGGQGSLPTDHGFNVNVGGHHRGSPPGGFFGPHVKPHQKYGPPGE